MNKFLLSLLCTSLLFAHEKPQPIIIDYQPDHKNAIISIAFENPEKFLAGYSVVTRSGMPEGAFIAQARLEIAALFDKEENYTKVLLLNDKVIGFIEFHKAREICVKDMQEQFALMGLPDFSEEQILQIAPQVKKTLEECAYYIELECLAVSQEFRHQGYGRMLLEYAIEVAKEMYPEIKEFRLNVNMTNEAAIQLYESEGFVKSEIQPAPMKALEAIQYEKILN